VRVVGEAELDGVLEHDGGAVAEVIEQGCGRAERGRECVGARRRAAFAERLDKRRVRRELVRFAARVVPLRGGETFRERGRALERVLASG